MILLYLGAMLVGFELVSQISHLPGFAILLVYHFFRFLASAGSKPLSTRPKITRTALGVLLRIALFPFFTLMILMAMVVIILWFIGRILQLVNSVLNKLYQRQVSQLRQQQPQLMQSIIRRFLPEITNAEILSAMEQIRVPFLALIGLVLLTLGFVLQLVGA